MLHTCSQLQRKINYVFSILIDIEKNILNVKNKAIC